MATKTPTIERSAQNTADPPAISMIRLDQVAPSALNPRKSFDVEDLSSLADSLAAHGLLQPITVRSVEISGLRSLDAATVYEIVAGERRYRAAKQLGWESIPAIVRQVDDRELLELALVENLARKDIDPIEEAQGYRQLSDMGYTQEQIAQKVNRSRPVIANAMRLLELPGDVLQRIAIGELSTSHGKAILAQADKRPELQSAIAASVVERKLPVSEIEKSVNHSVYDDLVKKHLAKTIDWSVPFTETCQKHCPLAAYRPGQYGGNGYCLRPDHFVQLVEEGKAKEEAAAQAVLAKAKDSQVLKLDSLHYGQYKDLRYYQTPACTPQCECRAVAIAKGGETVNVCLKPSHFQALCNTVIREESKQRRGDFAEKQKQIETLLATESDSVLRHVAAVLFHSLMKETRQDIAKAISEEIEDQELSKRIANGRYGGDSLTVQAGVFAKQPLSKLLALAGRILARSEIRESLEFKRNELGTLDFLLAAPKSPASGELLGRADKVAIAQEELARATTEIERLRLELTAANVRSREMESHLDQPEGRAVVAAALVDLRTPEDTIRMGDVVTLPRGGEITVTGFNTDGDGGLFVTGATGREYEVSREELLQLDRREAVPA